MVTQSSSSSSGMPPKHSPRKGQVAVWDLVEKGIEGIHAKLPTGYGKTYTFDYSFLLHKAARRCNRMLVVFPTRPQLEQYVADGPGKGMGKVIDMTYFKSKAYDYHLKDKAEIFAVTIQTLVTSGGTSALADLMATGDWFVVFDEYHHYGEEKVWGRKAKTILKLAKHYMVLSATPYRPNDDSAFGEPHVSITYREAEQEEAVSKLIGHGYNYRIDLVDEDRNVISFDTTQISTMAGDQDLDSVLIERRMRMSPKYISPLISIPLTRMLSTRIHTGVKVQAIIFAMSVNHAQLICTQVKKIFPELAVDWIGTGTKERTDKQNKSIREKFCGKKNELTGIRQSNLDVLVNVGMAGEGLDTVNVTEIIFCRSTSGSNTDNQAAGRGARVVRDAQGKIIDCYVNYDSSCHYHPDYNGENFMDAMDNLPPSQETPDDSPSEPDGLPDPLPREPEIYIYNLELLNVDSGNPEIRTMAAVMKSTGKELNYEAMEADPDHDDWEVVISFFQKMRSREIEALNETSKVMQLHEQVKAATRVVTGVAIGIISGNSRYEDTRPGDIKHRINGRKKMELGPIDKEDPEVLTKHYHWLVNLDKSMRESKKLPVWLV